jgi:hypothetical protein
MMVRLEAFERVVTQKLRKDVRGLLVLFRVKAHPHEALEHAHVRPRQEESRVTVLADAGPIVVEAVCPKTANQESAGYGRDMNLFEKEREDSGETSLFSTLEKLN